MRLTSTGSGWALVDGPRRRLAAVAGGLGAWAPRLVGGEGAHILPLTGKVSPLEPLPPIDAALLRRRLWLDETSPGPSLGVVLGAPVLHRRDPVRCVLGYVHVGPGSTPERVALGSVLVTAAALKAAAVPGQASIAEALGLAARLPALDGLHHLKTGDVLLARVPALSAAQARLLLGCDLADGDRVDPLAIALPIGRKAQRQDLAMVP